MFPKKANIEKLFLKVQIWLSQSFSFFNFNIFQEHFFAKDIYIFLNQYKILDLSYTQYEISPLKRAIFHIFGHKTTNEKETGQNEEKYLS